MQSVYFKLNGYLTQQIVSFITKCNPKRRGFATSLVASITKASDC